MCGQELSTLAVILSLPSRRRQQQGYSSRPVCVCVCQQKVKLQFCRCVTMECHFEAVRKQDRAFYSHRSFSIAGKSLFLLYQCHKNNSSMFYQLYTCFCFIVTTATKFSIPLWLVCIHVTEYKNQSIPLVASIVTIRLVVILILILINQ